MRFRPAPQLQIKPHITENISSHLGDITTTITVMATASNNSSDFLQWLHAMKMVARLPGGMPPEFRRKLWLALAEQHLQSKNIDWAKEEPKCMCEENGEDDEELGIQIVKDLHRTGSSLCSGPAGSVNQGKLKRVLLGYTRWNPEVGYCQGFNMLGALILQVMDKDDIESLKIMIFLIEGILPAGYFSGSLSGLQADMAVFRELLSGRLPKLSKHLQRLQGPIGEDILEPPLTNVFTMQWFLTLFCTCLPINCVLRVWDLVLIEGSDILLRTALAIWGLLEERILATKTADDFYCKMGMLSGELLNGHLFDSNGLIQKIVDLGPVQELQKLRDKHLHQVTPWKDKRGLRLFFSDEEGDSDDEARLEVSTAWGLRLGRRGSMGQPTPANRSTSDGRDRIALDISILKRQYEKLRERQRQAHIILTSTSRQGIDGATAAASSLPVNQYLQGRNAIVSSKGRRIGPPAGAIPPIRKVQSMKGTPKINVKSTKKSEGMQWKEINANTAKQLQDVSAAESKKSTETSSAFPLKKSSSVTSTTSTNSETSPANSSSLRSRKKSESSSYSDDSDGNSSTSTSLCDEENFDGSISSVEASPHRRCVPISSEDTDVIEMLKTSKLDECISTLNKLNLSENCEILTCISEEMSCSVADSDHEANVVDETEKLEVIYKDTVDVNIEETNCKTDFENITCVLETEDVFPNEDASTTVQELNPVTEEVPDVNSLPEIYPNNDLYQEASNLTQSPEQPDESIQAKTGIDEYSPVGYTMPIDLIQRATNYQESKENIPSVLEKMTVHSQSDLETENLESIGTLSIDTINLLKRIENSEFDATLQPVDSIASEKCGEEHIDSIENASDEHQDIPSTSDVSNNKTRDYTEINSSLFNNNLVENTDHSNENLLYSITIKDKTVEAADCDFKIQINDPPADSCTFSIINVNTNSNSNDKPIETYTDQESLSSSRSLYSEILLNEDITLNIKSVLVDEKYSVQKVSEEDKTNSIEETNLLISSVGTNLPNLDSCYTPEIVPKELEICYTGAKRDDTQLTGDQLQTECFTTTITEDILELDTLQISSTESKPSSSNLATKSLLENDLLMEHILNPIVHEKASIDDVLIEHFTSLSLDINKKPNIDQLDIDDIEEIRRKYLASTKSLSDSLHEAEEQTNFNVFTTENQAKPLSPVITTNVINLSNNTASLSSPLLSSSDDHLPKLSTSPTAIEISSELHSLNNPSSIPIASPTISDEPKAVPSTSMIPTVSKLSPASNAPQPPIDDENGLFSKDNNAPSITSTSQLLPMVDFSKYLSTSSISPLRTPANSNASYLTYSENNVSSLDITTNRTDVTTFEFKVNDEGVTNEYFERVTVPPERPSRLELRSSTSDDTCAIGFVNDDLTRDIHLNAFVGDSSVDSSPKTRPTDDVFDDDSFGFRSYAAASKKEHDFMKEKSFSLDEPSVHRDQFKPLSCPENALDVNPIRKSERVSRIIQENSKILHRFLRRNVCVDEEELSSMEVVRADVGEVSSRKDEVPYKVDLMDSSMSKYAEDRKSQEQLDLYSGCLKANDILLDRTEITHKTCSEKYLTEVTNSILSFSSSTIPRNELAHTKHSTSAGQLETMNETVIEPIDSSAHLIEMHQTLENETNDISETISSIKNTIKSIDTLCKRDDSSKRSRDKTIEVIESLNECRYRKIDPNLRGECAPSASRISRDMRREISPRRTGRDSDREEYESLFKRDSTMSRSTSVLPTNSSTSDLDRLYQMSTCPTSDDAPNSSRNSFPPINFSYPIRAQESTSLFVKVSNNDDLDPNASPAHTTYTPPNKSHIRHTTVTSTFYDRIQAQQKEKTLRMDRSPTAHRTPVNITKAYLNSLRVTAPVGFSPRSAGTSPFADHQLTKKDHSGSLSAFVVPPPFRQDLTAYNKLPYKSCDNIPEKSKSNLTCSYKYA